METTYFGKKPMSNSYTLVEQEKTHFEVSRRGCVTMSPYTRPGMLAPVLLSCVQLFLDLMDYSPFFCPFFPRKECWNGLLFPTQGYLPNPET